MWFSILLCGILCTQYPVSGELDQQCIDKCTCCIDKDCGEKYDFKNACLKGCIDGHRGRRCYELCQDPNCKSCGGMTHSNVCTECSEGYFLGQNKSCIPECPPNCKSCSSSTNCAECKDGFHDYNGQHCVKKCSSQCMNGTCSKDTGRCLYGCKKDFFGDKCCVKSENCLNCYSNTECKTCKSGYFQHSCKQRCPIYCLGQCEMATGVCSGCLYNRFGAFCNFDCSRNCKTIKGNISRCAQSDGTCIFGCEDGYYGPTCNKSCKSICVQKVCKQDTGICSFGCSLKQDEPECFSSLESREAVDLEKMTIIAVLGSLLGFALMIIVLLIIIITVRKSSRRLSTRQEVKENQGVFLDVHSTRATENSREITTSPDETDLYENITKASGEITTSPDETDLYENITEASGKRL